MTRRLRRVPAAGWLAQESLQAGLSSNLGLLAPAPPSRLIIYHLVIATRLIVMDSCSNGPIIVPFVILRAGSSLYRDLSGLICHHLVFIIR